MQSKELLDVEEVIRRVSQREILRCYTPGREVREKGYKQ